MAEQVEDVLLLGFQRRRAGRVFAEQRADQWGVRQVREDGAVAGDDEPPGVAATDPAGVHLLLEEARPSLEQRPEHGGQLLHEDGTALERLPAGQPDEVGALHEEAECGADHPLHLGPALGRLGRHGLVHQGEPVVEGVEQHGAVERDLRREVVEEARRPDADLVGDVGQAGARETPLGEPLTGDHQDRVPGAQRRRRHPPSVRLPAQWLARAQNLHSRVASANMVSTRCL